MSAVGRMVSGVDPIVLGRHHLLQPARGGVTTCDACGRSYGEGTIWRAEVDPCADGKPTGVTEAEAQFRTQLAVTQALEGIYNTSGS